MRRNPMLTLAFLLVGSAAGAQTVLPAANVSAAAVQEPAVATFAGQAITASQLEAEAGARLLKVRNEEYRIKAELARDLAFGKLQDAAARTLGIDRVELYRQNVTAKSGEPAKAGATKIWSSSLECGCLKLVEPIGIEPMTSSLQS